MSNQTSEVTSVGFPLASILTIIFVLAKIFGAVTWSWWWVFSPLWISALAGLSIFAVIIVFAVIFKVFIE